MGTGLLSPLDAGGRRGLIETPSRDPVDLEIVVPALNEERRIGPALEAFVEYLKPQPYAASVVVVDGGSVDRTPEVVEDVEAASPVPVHLINCGSPGKGAAVRRGVVTSQARFLGFAGIGEPFDTQALDRIWPLFQAGAQVVVGPAAEAVAPAGSFWRRGWRALDQMLASLPPRRAAGAHLSFEFFERSAALELFSLCVTDGAGFDLMLVASARAAGLSVREIPVVSRQGSVPAALDSSGTVEETAITSVTAAEQSHGAGRK